jgi:streptogramin lyase
MNVKRLNALLVALVICLGWSIAWSAQPQPEYPTDASFKTLITTPLAIEGLTGDKLGNLYTVGRNAGAGVSCPVWKINLQNPSLIVVGLIPSTSTQCSPSGLALNEVGDIFVSDGNRISFFTPNSVSPPTASVYATGVPGTNGVAFDSDGNLWTGDGTQNQGRVWKISGPGANCATATNCNEVFRIQPMNNSLNVGRTNTTNPGTPQNLVANGLAFNADGDLFVADTARGALWQVKFNLDGTLKSHLGCDTTFASNTLCLNHVFRADPRLEGADGIALDQNGNIWVSVNERNAIAIFGAGVSAEVFRNPVNTDTGLRNASKTDNSTILEFPTSPFLSGTTFCTANSDGNRRDNSPNTAGEIGGTGLPLGKISCMEQELFSPGLELPVTD